MQSLWIGSQLQVFYGNFSRHYIFHRLIWYSHSESESWKLIKREFKLLVDENSNMNIYSFVFTATFITSLVLKNNITKHIMFARNYRFVQFEKMRIWFTCQIFTNLKLFDLFVSFFVLLNLNIFFHYFSKIFLSCFLGN